MPLAAIILTVTLAAPFGTAEAEATDIGLPLEVVVAVEVTGVPEAVLARIVTAAGELDPVAMVSRHDGTWGATVRLTEREDVRVAFEALGADGESVISESHRLSELGVDPAVFAVGGSTTTLPGGWSLPDGAGWLAVAVTAAALALAALAFWARRRGVDTLIPDDVLSADPDRLGDPDNDDRSG